MDKSWHLEILLSLLQRYTLATAMTVLVLGGIHGVAPLQCVFLLHAEALWWALFQPAAW